jgi:hypothetical protein
MMVTMDAGTVLGLLGVVFTLASFAMKRMAPLRVLALVSNVFFVGYGYLESLLPSLVLYGALLPLNAMRLWELKRLSKDIERATQDSPISYWLLPHMRRRSFKAGEVLLRKDEPADRLIYVVRGELAVAGSERRIGAGELVGEIGLFSPDRKRTQTIVCATDGELFEMTDELIQELCFQNPKLGYHLMRLITERLLRDVRRQDSAPA